MLIIVFSRMHASSEAKTDGEVCSSVQNSCAFRRTQAGILKAGKRHLVGAGPVPGTRWGTAAGLGWVWVPDVGTWVWLERGG